MSDLIGDIMIKKEIDLGKGYLLKTQWTIIPACPKLHAALFSKMEEENKDADANGLHRDSSYVPSDATDETKESEGMI